MEKLDLYIADALVLVVAVYLHSPLVCLGAVVLWAVVVAESVLTRKNRDAEIAALLLRMEKIEKEHKHLSMDITNVAERAKTILGEQF